MFVTTAALIVFLLPLAWSPGPGNMFFAAIGARYGFAASLPASFGYHVATWLVTFAAGLGFLAVMQRAPAVFHVLRIAGAVYVLYLAWRMYRAGRLTDAIAARPAGVFDGAVLLVLNPKAYVIIALMFSTFLADDDPQRLTSILLITTVFTFNNLIAFAGWSLLGDVLSRSFRSQTGARRINTAFALMLAAVAVWMLLG